MAKQALQLSSVARLSQRIELWLRAAKLRSIAPQHRLAARESEINGASPAPWRKGSAHHVGASPRKYDDASGGDISLRLCRRDCLFRDSSGDFERAPCQLRRELA